MECCAKVSGANCHCGLCHQTFGTLAAFDDHQVRRYGTSRPVTCHPAAGFGRLGLVQDDRGVWRTPEGVARYERVRGMMAGFSRARRRDDA
jgi:hypothetical protein